MDYLECISYELTSNLNNQLNNVVIKTRCKVEITSANDERIYFVDNTPFLKHVFKFKIEFKDNVATATLGTYQIL